MASDPGDELLARGGSKKLRVTCINPKPQTLNPKPKTLQVPTADRLLSGLCDIRLPLGMSEEECAALAAVIAESVRAVVAR